MIRIDMIRQTTNHPNRRRRHLGRASCDIAGRRFEATGPAPVYKLSTLLWLHGYRGELFEVHNDVSPFGKLGGLAMRWRVRNCASFETPNGNPIFRMKSQPDPDFTPKQRVTAENAAGVVVSMNADSRRTFAPGCATSPSDCPEYPQKEDRASTRVVTAHTPEAA